MHYRTLVRIPKRIDEENHEDYLAEVMEDFSEHLEKGRLVTLARPDWGPWVPPHYAFDMSENAIPNIIKLMLSDSYTHQVTDAVTQEITWRQLFRSPVVIDDVRNIYDSDGRIHDWYADEWGLHLSAKWVIPIDSDTGELFAPLRIEDNGCWDWYVEGGRWAKELNGETFDGDLAHNRMKWGEYKKEKEEGEFGELLIGRWETLHEVHEHYKDDKDVKEYLDCINHASLDLFNKYKTELIHPGYLKIRKLCFAKNREAFDWMPCTDLHLTKKEAFFEHHKAARLFAPFVFEEGKVGKFDSYYWKHQHHCHIHWNTRLMAFRMWVDKWDDEDWVVTVDIHN